MDNLNHDEVGTAQPEAQGEVLDELLRRYERVLVFAGQLQERLKQQRLLAEQTESLQEENERLRRVVAAGEAYIKVLESALAGFAGGGEKGR
ncbi:MAG: hypothetical protein Kow001_24920 [Acidobacteriota bacterium]